MFDIGVNLTSSQFSRDRDEVVSRAPDTLGMYIKSCIEAEIPIPEPLDATELRSADVGEIMVITCFAEEQE